MTLTLFVAAFLLYLLQRRRCGRCWRTAARLRSPCTAPVRTGRTSRGSTTAPRPSSCGPSCRGRSSASRKWFTAARSPVSLTPKVGARSVSIVLPGVWEGYLRVGIECVKRVKIYVSGNIWSVALKHAGRSWRWKYRRFFQQPVWVLCCERVLPEESFIYGRFLESDKSAVKHWRSRIIPIFRTHFLLRAWLITTHHHQKTAFCLQPPVKTLVFKHWWLSLPSSIYIHLLPLTAVMQQT